MNTTYIKQILRANISIPTDHSPAASQSCKTVTKSHHSFGL